jgi:hypothetical protein
VRLSYGKKYGRTIYFIKGKVSRITLLGNAKMKVGIIRCAQTEDYCPGTTDYQDDKRKKGAFEGIGRDK